MLQYLCCSVILALYHSRNIQRETAYSYLLKCRLLKINQEPWWSYAVMPLSVTSQLRHLIEVAFHLLLSPAQPAQPAQKNSWFLFRQRKCYLWRLRRLMIWSQINRETQLIQFYHDVGRPDGQLLRVLRVPPGGLGVTPDPSHRLLGLARAAQAHLVSGRTRSTLTT